MPDPQQAPPSDFCTSSCPGLRGQAERGADVNELTRSLLRLLFTVPFSCFFAQPPVSEKEALGGDPAVPSLWARSRSPPFLRSFPRA